MMVAAVKYRTFAFTVRPRDGITDGQVKSFMTFIRRRCIYYHVVTEKSGSSRHVHAGVVFKEGQLRSSVLVQVVRIFKDLTTDEKSVLRSGVKIMYNWDFINSYLDKNDETVVVASCLPEKGHVESYFPVKPVKDGTLLLSKKCSMYYHELEALWYKHSIPGIEINTETVRDFLFNVMYNLRVLSVIRDDKLIVQTSRHLVRWLNKSTKSSIVLPVFEKEES